MTSLCQTGVNQTEQKCHDLISTLCNKLYLIFLYEASWQLYTWSEVCTMSHETSLCLITGVQIYGRTVHTASGIICGFRQLLGSLGPPPQTRETAAHRCAGAGSSWGLSNWVFKTKSHFVAQVCLKLTAALFQPPKYWDYRHEMSHLVQDWGFEIRGKS